MSIFNNFEDSGVTQSGLFRFVRLNEWTVPAPVPLQSVQVTVDIVQCVARVEVTQIFVNKEQEPIEAIYYFPIDPRGGVTHFHAEIEDKIIQGEVKEVKEARVNYEEANRNQETAVLGELEQSDIFKMSIGYLKPSSEAKIVIEFVTPVENVKDSNSLQFLLPTTIAPRYVPGHFNDPRSLELAKTISAEWTNVNFLVPMSIKVDVSIVGDIETIVCPNHPVKVTQNGRRSDRKCWSNALVELSYKIKEMDRNFVLLIVPKNANHKPQLFLEKLPLKKTMTVMAQLIPSFKLDDQNVELIFILDRSASMRGPNIELAKNILSLLIRSMPPNCYFNVVGFGGSHLKQFARSVKCDIFNYQKALHYAKNLTADMGGTEMLGPLKEIYSSEPIPGHSRQIFLLSDGNVANGDEVIGLTRAMEVKLNFQSTRIFTIGIGPSVSHHLIEGLAQAGQGTSNFIDSSQEVNVEVKVLQQLKDALQPSLTDVSLNWHLANSSDSLTATELTVKESPEVTETKLTLMGYGKPVEREKNGAGSPKRRKQTHQEKIGPIFDGSQILIFGTFPLDSDESQEKKEESRQPIGLTIFAQSSHGTLSVDLETTEESDLGPLTKGLLHKMAAIKIIKKMEQRLASLTFQPWPNFREEQKLKQEICAISRAHGILSKHTAVMAIDKEANSMEKGKVKVAGGQSMNHRIVQAQIPRHGWPAFKNSSQRPATFQPFSATGSGFSFTTTSTTPFGATLPAQEFNSPFRFGVPSSSNLFGNSSTQAPNFSSQSTFVSSAPAQKAFSFGLPSVSSSNSTGSLFGSSRSAPSTFGTPSSFKIGSNGESGQFSFGSSVPAQLTTTESSDEMKKLNLIISQQSSDGSFPFNDPFVTTLGFDFQLVKFTKGGTNISDEAWATALAVTFLKEQLGHKKFFWESTVNKATEWLEKNLIEPELQNLMDRAKDLFKS